MSRALYRHADLKRLVHPASIAVVGASPRAGSMGQRMLDNLKVFQGKLYPVNSRYEQIDGIPCYPSLATLPEVPDCVIAVAPREEVEGIVKQCGSLGVGGIIAFASGFAEMGTEERIAEQSRIGDIAQKTGVRLAGPNCIGLVNWLCGAVGTFLKPLGCKPSKAPAIGLVSQSGGLGFALAQAREHGVSISHVLSSGNSADVDVADFVAYLAEDDGCVAIACIFEGMAEPLRLLEAAEIARAAGKPLVVYKMATGEQGAEAALSHTGSLAGAHDAYLAGFERVGIIEVDRFEDLMPTAAFFAKMGRCKSMGTAVVSTSGGANIMVADTVETYGVSLPQPMAKAMAVLESKIPEFGSARNPCDITAQVVNDPESFTACVNALLEDDTFGALVVPFAFSYDVVIPRIEILNELAQRYGKAVCVVWLSHWLDGPGSLTTEAAEKVALFRSINTCFATLAKWQRWSQQTQLPLEPIVSSIQPAVRARVAEALQTHSTTVVSERSAKGLLADYGVPMVSDRLTTSAADCAKAATACGYPVVLKVESADIPHKTEAGVVRLNVTDEAMLRSAYDEIIANALKVTSKKAINGVLVQPMVEKGLEVIVGARIDPLFGPLVVVGLGGIFVELMRDSAVTLAPLSQDQALALLRRLKAFHLFKGFRGSAPVDLDELARIICRVGDFASDHRDNIRELDVNPLICTESRILGVDALIALHSRK